MISLNYDKLFKKKHIYRKNQTSKFWLNFFVGIFYQYLIAQNETYAMQKSNKNNRFSKKLPGKLKNFAKNILFLHAYKFSCIHK